MSRTGHRKRLPDNIHLLRGTFQPSRHGDRDKAPLLPPELPSPPQWLHGEALAEWHRILSTLGPARVLTKADAGVVAQACTMYAKLAADPESFRACDHAQLRLLYVELGMTPCARTRLPTVNEQPDNPFAEP